MILIRYNSTGAYKIFSPNENKEIISRDVQFVERKGWNWLKVLNGPMKNYKGSNHISASLQDDKVNEVAQTLKLRRSTKARTQSVRLTDYERFSDQAIGKNDDLIEEEIIAQCEPTKLNQALKDENQKEFMKKELKAIEKNHTWELVNYSSKENRRYKMGL